MGKSQRVSQRVRDEQTELREQSTGVLREAWGSEERETSFNLNLGQHTKGTKVALSLKLSDWHKSLTLRLTESTWARMQNMRNWIVNRTNRPTSP